MSRNSVTIACSKVTQLNSDRTFFSALAASLWAAAAAAAVGAAVTPWPVNLVLWIIAGAFAVSAAIATGFAIDKENKLTAANAVFATAEQAFLDAAAAVVRDCDYACYPDLAIPTCP